MPAPNEKTNIKRRPINLGLYFDVPKGPGKHGGYPAVKVDNNSSAAKAGVQVGDEVVAWNGKRPANEHELTALLEAVGVGGTIKLHLYRKDQALEVPMVLVEKKRVLSLDLEEIDEVLERKISP